jgi:hypothetical protein
MYGMEWQLRLLISHIVGAAGALHPIVLVRCKVVQRLASPPGAYSREKRVDEARYSG